MRRLLRTSSHVRPLYRASPAAFAVALLVTLALPGCDRAAREKRAARSAPLDRFELPVEAGAPVRVFTSRRGPQPAGRPQPVYVEVQMTRGVLSIATEIIGVGGVRVVGGNRLNHASAGKRRRIGRAITATLPPQSDGKLVAKVSWRTAIDTGESRLELPIPMPSDDHGAPHPAQESPGARP